MRDAGRNVRRKTAVGRGGLAHRQTVGRSRRRSRSRRSGRAAHVHCPESPAAAAPGHDAAVALQRHAVARPASIAVTPLKPRRHRGRPKFVPRRRNPRRERLPSLFKRQAVERAAGDRAHAAAPPGTVHWPKSSAAAAPGDHAPVALQRQAVVAPAAIAFTPLVAPAGTCTGRVGRRRSPRRPRCRRSSAPGCGR